MFIQYANRQLDEGRRRATHVVAWRVAVSVLCVVSIAATASITRDMRGDPAAASSVAMRIVAPVDTTLPALPSMVSVAPLDGRLLIVFPLPSAASSIRLVRHGAPFAMFGAPHVEQAPLVILPGELRVQRLPASGADFELRIPESVTQVHVRIGGRTMARWSGSPLTWDYGRRIPLQLPHPG